MLLLFSQLQRPFSIVVLCPLWVREVVGSIPAKALFFSPATKGGGGRDLLRTNVSTIDITSVFKNE
jgi:hypothetical protein